MITNAMRTYNYFTLGNDDAYGQAQLSQEPKGTVKMAVNLTSQSIQDNINYKDAKYVGLTFDRTINDSFVVDFNGKLLKVLYVNTFGRYTQVFMNEY